MNTHPAQPAAGPIWPVLLSGGSGTRLWPLSRTLHPKQLLPLAQSETMLQATAVRVTDANRFAQPVVVAGEDHRFLIADQLRALGQTPAAIILEPEGRNTAPAIALAAHWIAAHDPQGVMLVMPSDHVITRPEAFLAAVETALPAVRAGRLVAFGIAPDSPATGYGYIEQGASLPDMDGVRAIARFVEKPDQATAEAFIATGRFAWNGGIFLFRVDTLLAALTDHAPRVAAPCAEAMAQASVDGLFVRPDAGAFRAAQSISIDYAVMERTRDAAVVPVDMGWSDVGSWDALWQIGRKDPAGNVRSGTVWALETTNSLLRSEEDAPALATIGLDDMIVVATRDVVMVAPRARSQDVKRLVDQLKTEGRDEWKLHHVVHRPWGSYQTTDSGERFQTKRIVVKPGEKLSLQLHHHRSEHWIVVSGTARVTVGEQAILLQENQSTYIPAGTVHRLENPGRIPLHLIEVQCGPYLGEDDIVRLQDTYGRADTAG